MKSLLTPKQSVEAIKTLQPVLNAAITIVESPEENTNDGLFANVPVVLKDNVSTKGIRTTASSRILENYVPVYDATIVKKMKEQGAVIVAKASMDELGMGGTNRNALIGPAYNPWNQTTLRVDQVEEVLL